MLSYTLIDLPYFDFSILRLKGDGLYKFSRLLINSVDDLLHSQIVFYSLLFFSSMPISSTLFIKTVRYRTNNIYLLLFIMHSTIAFEFLQADNLVPNKLEIFHS